MKNDKRIAGVKSRTATVSGRVASAVSKIRGGAPGEMALQNLIGHPATQSIQQGLVRLVGYRDPSCPALRRPLITSSS
jgi:hypothetical protein